MSQRSGPWKSWRLASGRICAPWRSRREDPPQGEYACLREVGIVAGLAFHDGEAENVPESR